MHMHMLAVIVVKHFKISGCVQVNSCGIILNVRVGPERERSCNDVRAVFVTGARLRCHWADHRASAGNGRNEDRWPNVPRDSCERFWSWLALVVFPYFSYEWFNWVHWILALRMPVCYTLSASCGPMELGATMLRADWPDGKLLEDWHSE
jgi:hypothetical protein